MQLLHDQLRLLHRWPPDSGLSRGDQQRSRHVRDTLGPGEWPNLSDANQHHAVEDRRLSHDLFLLARSPNGFRGRLANQGGNLLCPARWRGKPLPPGEIKTPGTSGMRTGILTLSGANGSTLVAWKKDGRLGWQLYDTNGKPNGPAGSAKSAGDGIAGVVDRDGEFILFR